MTTEAQLWTWFLFGGALPTARAKSLLYEWQQRGLTLAMALEQAASQAPKLGLTPEEALKMRPPATVPEQTALTWNAPGYPAGLRLLPLKVRPALLFYLGAVDLFARPILYLPPVAIAPEAYDDLRETLSLLAGEYFLPAAFRNSAQAALLLEELETTEGELLLFARQGCERITLSATEQALLDAGRLLVVTPLPPTAESNPAWDSVLEQIAAATAGHCITTATTFEQVPGAAPATILLAAEDTTFSIPEGMQRADTPADVLTWLLEMPLPDMPVASPNVIAEPLGDFAMPLDLPPLAPADALRTLETGGRVPEILRKKLLGLP